MKKRLCLLLAGILTAMLLTGCSDDASTDVGDAPVDFNPDTTAQNSSVQDVAQALSGEPAATDPVQQDVPIDTPIETAEPDAPAATSAPADGNSISLSSYKFETLADTSFGFTFSHPTHWENLPGKHTVCFREVVTDGDFPARVALTKKKLTHTPDSEDLIAEFQSFAATIQSQYDSSTFEYGDLVSGVTFMGKKNGYSITYLAYSGDIEIKGYIAVASIDRTMYVFHFTASYKDYEAMTTIMERMRDSATPVES